MENKKESKKDYIKATIHTSTNLWKIIQDSNSHFTWKPKFLSFPLQYEWSRWGRSWPQVEQNFHTCPGTLSVKIHNTLNKFRKKHAPLFLLIVFKKIKIKIKNKRSVSLHTAKG